MSCDAARRLILGSTGLAHRSPDGVRDVRHFRRVMRHLDLVQLDSVNVSARTHHWVFFARLGPYDRDRLDDWLWRSGEHFEYWAHEASILPVANFPLLEYRMRGARERDGVPALESEHPGYLGAVLAEVNEHGPITVSDLSDPGSRTGPWWGYGRGKVALEWHFRRGTVSVADRRNFQRSYDITERIIPDEHVGRGIDRDDAILDLIERSVEALGVGTIADIADYYRLHKSDCRRLLPRVVSSGRVYEVAVKGWNESAYRHAGASIPRSVHGVSLISPFDPLIWFRDRAQRVFGLHYRIEIYVPAPKRTFGYYVLPVLMDGRIVARVDLKTDRGAGVLRVRSAHLEAGESTDEVSARLADHLETTAGWLDCDSISVEDWGDLTGPLKRHLT